MTAPLSSSRSVDQDSGDLRVQARLVLERNWDSCGYTAPNRDRYPWQWLWDSCFHTLAWQDLGEPERAVQELTSAMRWQGPEGFVPHMGYQREPDVGTPFWGRRGCSTITQPPMYGLATASLATEGVDVTELAARATRGLRFLFRARRRACGLLAIAHPWEAGTDDSPRFDRWATAPYSVARWARRKRELVDTLELGPDGGAVANPDFSVCPVSFNALFAFNAIRLAEVTGDDWLRNAGVEITEALATTWDEQLRTWVDLMPDGSTAGRERTLDALLPLLVVDDERQVEGAVATLSDPAGFAAPYGPAGVHRTEPAFQPDAYWRGAAWPPLTYLLWLAATRRHRSALADDLAVALRSGVRESAFSEYHNPLTGARRGARPQSWCALAVLVGGTPVPQPGVAPSGSNADTGGLAASPSNDYAGRMPGDGIRTIRGAGTKEDS